MNNCEQVKKDLGNHIATARLKLGKSQRLFAQLVGLDRSVLRIIEAGAGNPTLETLIKISDGLNIPIASLFSQLQEGSSS